MPVPFGTEARPSDAECRLIRLAASRSRLESLLEMALAGRTDVRTVMSSGLACMPAYRKMEREGLAHAFTIRDDGRGVIVLAGTNRVWRKRPLKRRLIAVRRAASRLGQRVLLVTERGLQRVIARQQAGSPHGLRRTA